ncbi:MAG: DUF881 domain-containing protein [Micromonosporaceae bacterium]|jgi:uncharacterized protein YlxW (UPF0749 family)
MSTPPNADRSASPDPPEDAAAGAAEDTDAGATGAPAADAAVAGGGDAAPAGGTGPARDDDTGPASARDAGARDDIGPERDEAVAAGGTGPAHAGGGEPAPGGAGPAPGDDPHAREADTADRAGPAEAPQAAGTAPPRQRASLSGVVLALLLGLLGFTLVAQVRSVDTDTSLPAARQEELVRILADLDAHESRLRQEIAELEETLERLTTAGQSRQEALEEATRRADELGILAGILPVQGPGVIVQITAGQEPISAARLLDTVQELRGAGAEAIQITDGAGTQVRVVASTYFVDAEDGAVRVDGHLLRGPYTITAVGEPQTLLPALAIPGGVVESVQSAGGTVTVDERPDGVLVTAVREPAPLRYATPVS